MKMRKHISISAPPEVIWPLIADPLEVARWNPKLVAVDRTLTGPVRLAERYQVIYQMSGRQTESAAEVVECRHLSRLVVRYRVKADGPDRYVDEVFSLKGGTWSKGTRVTQEIDLTHSPIPRVFQLVAWLINAVGKTRGKPYLQTLKELAEASDG